MDVNAEGLEIDDFDVLGTTYCLVHLNERHQASLRLRRAADGTMLERAFGDVWARHGGDLAGGLEVTRLCSGRFLAEPVRQAATVELLLGLCRFGVTSGQRDLFGIVYPAVARTIQRAGWECEVMDRFEHDGRAIVLARWECSSLVDWQLQERLETLEIVRPAAAVAKIAAA